MARKFFNGIDLQNNRGINFASPSVATDGVNKQYVDNLVNGLIWKPAVQAATTTSGTLSSSFAAGQVIDGYTLQTGDAILIKNQTTAAQNGVYIVAASGAPTTAPWAVTGELVTNSTVRVNNGLVNADHAWTLTTIGIITVGTTGQTWVQSDAGTPYAAGNGLSLSSDTFSVVAGTGIIANVTGVSINTAVVATKYSTTIGDGSSTTFTVTHNLGTQNVLTLIYNATTYEVVDTDVTNATANTVTLTFAAAPAASAYTVAVIG